MSSSSRPGSTSISRLRRLLLTLSGCLALAAVTAPAAGPRSREHPTCASPAASRTPRRAASTLDAGTGPDFFPNGVSDSPLAGFPTAQTPTRSSPPATSTWPKPRTQKRAAARASAIHRLSAGMPTTRPRSRSASTPRPERTASTSTTASSRRSSLSSSEPRSTTASSPSWTRHLDRLRADQHGAERLRGVRDPDLDQQHRSDRGLACKRSRHDLRRRLGPRHTKTVVPPGRTRSTCRFSTPATASTTRRSSSTT